MRQNVRDAQAVSRISGCEVKTIYGKAGVVMKFPSLRLLIAAGMCQTGLSAMPAFADSSSRPENNKVFARQILATPEAFSSGRVYYARIYTAVHLTAHPSQKVRKVLELFRREVERGEEFATAWRFRFGVNLRGRAIFFAQAEIADRRRRNPAMHRQRAGWL